MGAAEGLKGCRVLIVEDEIMISLMLQDWLLDMGCEVVGTAARFEAAARECAAGAFDVALVDVTLHGERSFPIAETMQARRKPFVLTTGYATTVLPDSLRRAPLLQKPYGVEELQSALTDAMYNG